MPHDAYRPTFVKSLAMTPIRRRDPIGAIGTYWRIERTIAPDRLELLQALADTAAVALRQAEQMARPRSCAEPDERRVPLHQRIEHHLRVSLLKLARAEDDFGAEIGYSAR
ncbi:hypothetical protein [Polyangium sorediatum]|uniref:GAF domain-containing protein n=1 Tax=Polyangium sorediatum TaxID=889274 RepID=A0ABT6PAX9_9BACT|nr:hypothetical protein [Polyangium sorediatum]MDI1437688.1 hypothetical protein [Polyangium sorediatum]